VRDVTQTTTTDEAYGAGGELLWRYTGGDSLTRAFVPFQGRILAEYYSGGTLFDHSDELGSISTANDQTGNSFQERLFKPYGELWTGAGYNFSMHQTFAQLPDYDGETDQYNTLNRHYSPSGRWLSPDPGGLKVVHLDDPQTWNMYAYVRNNPTTLADPSGLTDDPPAPKGVAAAHSSNGCDEHDPTTCAPDPAAEEERKPPSAAQGQQNLVLVVTHDQPIPNPFVPGVKQRDINYTIETKQGDSFRQDTTGKPTVSMTEKQTGGNDKPRLSNPNAKFQYVYQDSISVSAPGKSFSTTQTFFIDGKQATIYKLDPDTKTVVSGTHACVQATDKEIKVSYGP
jgi:RHS repeat-associated protein